MKSIEDRGPGRHPPSGWLPHPWATAPRTPRIRVAVELVVVARQASAAEGLMGAREGAWRLVEMEACGGGGDPRRVAPWQTCGWSEVRCGRAAAPPAPSSPGIHPGRPARLQSRQGHPATTPPAPVVCPSLASIGRTALVSSHGACLPLVEGHVGPGRRPAGRGSALTSVAGQPAITSTPLEAHCRRQARLAVDTTHRACWVGKTSEDACKQAVVAGAVSVLSLVTAHFSLFLNSL